jgi:tripartite-type tricarboxylate transporter receptor subunit TctC
MQHLKNAPRRALLGAVAGAALLAVAPAALAQAWPSKPIRLVVAAPAGGTSDIVARTLADGLTSLLGQTVIVDNKPGGLGAIAAQDLLSSPRDGYTFLIVPNALVSEVPHIAKPRFDPFKDIKPLAELSRSGLVMVGNASLPASNLKELVAYVKANPGKVSYGSAGHGSLNHLTGELFKLRAGLTDLPHVPYRGAGPGLTDLLAGQIPSLVPAMTNIVLEHHRAGKLRVLAVTHHKRLAAAPELPTTGEQGFPDVVAPNFIGLFTPAGVPRDIVNTLSAANLKLCGDKSYQDLLISGTFELEPLLSAADYKKYVESELVRWRPIVTAMGIKID